MLVTAVTGLAVGILIGAFAVLLWGPRRSREDPVSLAAPDDPSVGIARRSLELMQKGVVVLDSLNETVLVNAAATALGVADESRVDAELLRLARRARHDRRPSSGEIELSPTSAVRVEALPLDIAGHVAAFIEDLSESRRVDAVRRDFVANVSHELKTPVGALGLLAEAVVEGYDTDPEDVRRFALRMKHESDRLARLVQDLIDLSRLQGGLDAPAAEPVAVDTLVAEAVDRHRLAAESRQITVTTAGDCGALVRGSEAQLTTAVANLIDNAISYSPDHTRIVLVVRRHDKDVEIGVSDEGIGIGRSDLDRVFERFYRADPARSRSTGGTGLGLAIVKHVVANHGGHISVRSAEGSGSTFTIRLPAVEVEAPNVLPGATTGAGG